MKESIKKQPPDWKKIVLLIAGWLVLAALGGLVAYCGLCCDRAKDCRCNYKKRSRRTKVDIPGDEDPNSGQEMDETMTASSENAPVDSSGSGSEISSSTADGSVLMKVSQKARFPRARMETKRQRERRRGGEQ